MSGASDCYRRASRRIAVPERAGYECPRDGDPSNRVQYACGFTAQLEGQKALDALLDAVVMRLRDSDPPDL